MAIFEETQGKEFLEWDVLASDIPIRQGDLLVKKEGVAAQHTNIVLVITADCDIARDKHEGAIAALRVIAFSDFVRHRWAQTAYEDLLSAELPQLTNTFNNNCKAADGETTSVSSEAFANWLEKEEPADLCKDIADVKDHARALKAARSAHVLLGFSNPLGTDAIFDRYALYLVEREGIEPHEARRECLNFRVRGAETCPRRRASLAMNDRRGGQVGLHSTQPSW